MSEDLNALLGKAREMQTRMQEVQRQLAARRVEASAGGGMVTAVATGDLRILEVRIEPGLLESDLPLVQDLVAAAVNAALAKAQQLVQQELQRAAGLPDLGGLLGGLGGAGGAGPGR